MAACLLCAGCNADPPPQDDQSDSTTAASPTTTTANPTTTAEVTTSQDATAGGRATTGLASTGTSGPADSSDSNADNGTPPIFDVSIPDAAGEDPPAAEPWLVHVGVAGGERHLFQVDIETAVATDLCVLINTATMQPIPTGAASITFTRDDRLLFTNGTGTNLWEIELPSCLATNLGPIGVSGVYGISPDEGNDLYGLSAVTNSLIHIDAMTVAASTIGPLGATWGNLGGTWNEAEQQILGINGETDSLYEVDGTTGTATLVQSLPLDYSFVGMEYHPLNGQIYSCTADSHLYRLEDDGSLTDLGHMGTEGSCTNLGAPWSEDIPLPPPTR